MKKAAFLRGFSHTANIPSYFNTHVIATLKSLTKLNIHLKLIMFYSVVVTLIILSIVYLIGCLLSYSMIRVEHEAEGQLFTKGDRVITFCMSLLSYITILFILITTWISKINKTGYWKRPLKQKDE